MPNNLQSLESAIEAQKQIKSSNVGQDHSKGGSLLGVQDAEFQAYNQALEAKSDYVPKTQEQIHNLEPEEFSSEAERLAGSKLKLEQLEEQKAKLIVPAVMHIKKSIPGMICMTSPYDTCWDSDQERQKRLQKLEEKRLEIAIEEAKKKVAEYEFIKKEINARLGARLEANGREPEEQCKDEVIATPSSEEEAEFFMDRSYVIKDHLGPNQVV